jgi:hypothetical protein
VLSVDEKPSIQALERAQGYLKLPNGRPMIGESHDYKTTSGTGPPPCSPPSTFAAAPLWGDYRRRQRIEFSRLHEPRRSAAPGHGNPRDPGQPVHPQAEAGHVAVASTTPSSAATTIAPDPSSGQRASSIRSASSPVSRFSDSEYLDRYSQPSERAVLIVAT